MNLLLYSPNYAPELVGIGKYNAEFASWAAARGHDVVVITGMPHYPAWDVDLDYRAKRWYEEHIDGVLVRRVPIVIPPGQGATLLRRVSLETSFAIMSWRWWLPALARRERFDITIAIVPPLQDGHIPLIYSNSLGVPIVLHVQDLQVDAALNLGMLPGSIGAALRAWERTVLRRATWVTTITEEMRQRIITKGVDASRTSVMPNWADVDFIRPLPRTNGVRRDLGAGPEAVLAIYAGSIGEKQGLGVILDAARELAPDPRFKFAIVGNGSGKRHLQEMARGMGLTNLIFRDVYPWERMPELLAAADVHLVVQRREASGLVMPSKTTNILASGRPLIATAEPGTALHSLVAASGAGFTTRPGDGRDLARLLRKVAAQPARLAEAGQSGRRYAVSSLGKDRVLESFEELLDRLASAG